jgi:hypothetical protein
MPWISLRQHSGSSGMNRLFPGNTLPGRRGIFHLRSLNQLCNTVCFHHILCDINSPAPGSGRRDTRHICHCSRSQMSRRYWKIHRSCDICNRSREQNLTGSSHIARHSRSRWCNNGSNPRTVYGIYNQNQGPIRRRMPRISRRMPGIPAGIFRIRE